MNVCVAICVSGESMVVIETCVLMLYQFFFLPKIFGLNWGLSVNAITEVIICDELYWA